MIGVKMTDKNGIKRLHVGVRFAEAEKDAATHIDQHFRFAVNPHEIPGACARIICKRSTGAQNFDGETSVAHFCSNYVG